MNVTNALTTTIFQDILEENKKQICASRKLDNILPSEIWQKIFLDMKIKTKK